MEPTLGSHFCGRTCQQTPSVATVYHFYPATGIQPQVEHGGQGNHASGPKPVRTRLHYLHAHGFGSLIPTSDRSGASVRRRQIRQKIPQSQSQTVQYQKQKRPRSARSYPSCGQYLPYAGRNRTVRERTETLRPDLEADRRLPNGRCTANQRHCSFASRRRWLSSQRQTH